MSRHSITSTAVSPVNCRISFRLESSASNSVNPLTSSPKSNSPSSSCLGLGRESTTSDVVARVTEGERIRGCSNVVSGDRLAVWKIAYWRWKVKTLCREWTKRPHGQDAAEVRSKSRIALDTPVAQSCLEVVDGWTTRHPYLRNMRGTRGGQMALLK